MIVKFDLQTNKPEVIRENFLKLAKVLEGLATGGIPTLQQVAEVGAESTIAIKVVGHNQWAYFVNDNLGNSNIILGNADQGGKSYPIIAIQSTVGDNGTVWIHGNHLDNNTHYDQYFSKANGFQVFSVNGEPADEFGNVEIDTGGGGGTSPSPQDISATTKTGWNLPMTTAVILVVIDGNFADIIINLDGISSAGSASFEVPFTAHSSMPEQKEEIATMNNGTPDTGYMRMAAGSNIVNLYRNAAPGVNWSTGGAKTCIGAARFLINPIP